MQEHDHRITPDKGQVWTQDTGYGSINATSVGGAANRANVGGLRTSKEGTGDAGNLQPYIAVGLIIKF